MKDLFFINNYNTHMKIYVNKEITLNEFILIIKNKCFKDVKNVNHNDIWIYKLNRKK